MNSPRHLCDSSGRPWQLGQQLAVGGEGHIFALLSDSTCLAKVYKQMPSLDRADKLRWMVDSSSSQLRRFAAWPLTTLHEGPGKDLVGFIMPRLPGQLIYHLYHPAQRRKFFPKADWAFLVHTARNCAVAFENVHASGIVVGDVNQKNLLVSEEGMVSLIDCDSLQIRVNGHVFFCEGGVPEYTPPELQGQNFREVIRTVNHDAFGLAFIIFQLVFMGRSPFAGRYLGSGDLPIEQAIREFRFAYGPSARSRSMLPPPGMIDLDLVSPELCNLFERAFAVGSESPDARPRPAEWYVALDEFRTGMRACPAEPSHRIPGHLADCPWCKIVHAGGPSYFVELSLLATTFQVDIHVLSKLWEHVNRLKPGDLPAPPPVETAVVSMPVKASIFCYSRPSLPLAQKIVPTPLPEPVRIQRRRSRLAGCCALFSALLMSGFAFYVPLGVTGLIATWVFVTWWVFLQMKSGYGDEMRRRKAIVRQVSEELRRAEASWAQLVAHYNQEYSQCLEQITASTKSALSEIQEAKSAWGNQLYNYQAQFAVLKSELEAARIEYENLQSAYDVDRSQLEQNREALARDDFLRSRFISDYKITLVTYGRQQMLLYYGIETAFDVDKERILSVNGCGLSVAQSLLQWKSTMLADFRFDPKTGIPATELRALAHRYRQTQAAALSEIQQMVTALEDLPSRYRKELDSLLARIQNARGAIQSTSSEGSIQLQALTNRTQQKLRQIEERISELIVALAQAEADLQPSLRPQ